MAEYAWDAFISHAFEDKNNVARPLANHLAGFGLKVWLDESELHLGDSLREKIDTGLAQSRFGIVILSPSFFTKVWTKAELDGLVARENEGVKVILPTWHNLDDKEVRKYSPTLAGRVAAKTSDGLKTVAAKIIKSIENSGPIKRHADVLFKGRLTKKRFLGLPKGSFLLSNLVDQDLTPALAETIPTEHLREQFWENLTQRQLTKTSFYVFEDAAGYRNLMAARNFYVPEEVTRIKKRQSRKKFVELDIELARAFVAAGKSPPKAWRHLIKSLSFDDEKYKFNKLDGLSELSQLEQLDLFDVDPLSVEPLARLKIFVGFI
jgi:hypothetical protein